MDTNIETTDNGAVQLSFDADTGIATLTMAMEGGVNKINDTFGVGLEQAIAWALGQEDLKGIILASGHRDWCVGADIDMLYKERDAANLYERVRRLQLGYRALETCGVPVVAALTGSALGGGYELAMSCHHRVALNEARIQLGLPEVSLGVIPGAGGCLRLSRMIGIQAAMEIIAAGQMGLKRAPKAKGLGLVDALADSPEELRGAAEKWIADNPSGEQPWDKKGFRFPPPAPGTEGARDLMTGVCAFINKRTAGAYLAPQVAARAVYEGGMINMDRALEVEARLFVNLAVGDQCKDMIRTLWYHKNAADKHEGLPATEEQGIQKVGILGAGMMGAALGWVCAKAGYTVVLKDIKQEQVDAATAHCEKLTAKGARHLDDAGRAELLGRIKATLELDDLKGCDLIIEAVFEDIGLKHRVTKEVEPLMAEDSIWASNTSALPITDLAKASAHPERFIGLHFFSPVEKMPLLEIITGEQTDERTLARCLAFTRQRAIRSAGPTLLPGADSLPQAAGAPVSARSDRGRGPEQAAGITGHARADGAMQGIAKKSQGARDSRRGLRRSAAGAAGPDAASRARGFVRQAATSEPHPGRRRTPALRCAVPAAGLPRGPAARRRGRSDLGASAAAQQPRLCLPVRLFGLQRDEEAGRPDLQAVARRVDLRGVFRGDDALRPVAPGAAAAGVRKPRHQRGRDGSVRLLRHHPLGGQLPLRQRGAT